MSLPPVPFLSNHIPSWLRDGWGPFGFLSAPLKTRLIKGLGLMLLPLILLGTLSLYNLRRLDDTFRDLIEEITVEIDMMHRLRLHATQAALAVRYFEEGSSGIKTPQEEDLGRIIAAIDTIAGRFDPNRFALDEEDRRIEEIMTVWREIRDDGLQLAKAGELSATSETARRQRFLNGLATISRELRLVHELAEREMREDIAEFNATRRNTQRATLILFGGGVGIAVFAGLLLAGSILRPLARLEDAAQALGRGDLSVRVKPKNRDELALLMQTFNRMADELEQSHQALTELTLKDPLTNLYNRREFTRRLNDEIERAERYKRPVGLFMLDLDHFKQINDQYGHMAGDIVLQRAAGVLRDALRRVDTLYRYGGEEFVALLPEIGPASAAVLAERLRRTLAATAFVIDSETELRVTVSIGLALYPDDAADAETLVSLADGALYRAKEQGRDRVCCAGAPIKPA